MTDEIEFKKTDDTQHVHGTIVQITDESHHWFPALIVVTEVKAWGVMGYTIIVTNDESSNGQAYIRLKNDEFEAVGRAVIAVAEKE